MMLRKSTLVFWCAIYAGFAGACSAKAGEDGERNEHDKLLEVQDIACTHLDPAKEIVANFREGRDEQNKAYLEFVNRERMVCWPRKLLTLFKKEVWVNYDSKYEWHIYMLKVVAESVSVPTPYGKMEVVIPSDGIVFVTERKRANNA